MFLRRKGKDRFLEAGGSHTAQPGWSCHQQWANLWVFNLIVPFPTSSQIRNCSLQEPRREEDRPGHNHCSFLVNIVEGPPPQLPPTHLFSLTRLTFRNTSRNHKFVMAGTRKEAALGNWITLTNQTGVCLCLSSPH